MLGLTSYQEALRAIGRVAGQVPELRIDERAESGQIELTTSRGTRQIGAAELENIVLNSLAQRGDGSTAGETSDVLRSVGLALDELHALDVSLGLSPDRLSVRFVDHHARTHELIYAGDELEALRRAATARRNGQPLRRILILQAAPESASAMVELLVAEFAVQALPTPYARAVAASAEPPDLVLAQLTADTLEAVLTLRTGRQTATVPVLVVVAPESQVNADEFFVAHVDDILQEPVQPAQLRARIRTALLRGQSQ